MSHFSLLVITDTKPDNEELARILQPWHEYECTGIDDEYVVDVEVTEEVMKDWHNLVNVVKCPDGSFVSKYDNRFYTKEPTKKSTFSNDKEFELPAGHELTEIPQYQLSAQTGTTLAEFAEYDEKEPGRFYRKTNPNAHWDWWMTGGRWSGYFTLGYDPNTDPKNIEKCRLCGGTGKRLDMIVKSGCNGCQGSGKAVKWPTQWKQHNGDQIRLSDLDVEGLMTAAEQKAVSFYDEFHLIVAGRTVPNWQEVVKKHDENYADAREEYHAYEVIKDLNKNHDFAFMNYSDMACSKADYLKGVREGALPTFAMVYEGKWFQRGDMGWWGSVSEEVDKNQWNDEFNKRLAMLPPDTWLTIVDCHI